MIVLDCDLRHVKIWDNSVYVSRHMNFFKQLVYYAYELKMSFQPMDGFEVF